MKKIRTAIKSTLLIDPNEESNTNLVSIFNENSLELEIISNEKDYQKILEENKFDCVMINSDLDDNLADRIIDTLKIYYPWIVIVILLEEPTYEKVFSFVRAGADDFIIKPFNWESIEEILKFYYY